METRLLIAGNYAEANKSTRIAGCIADGEEDRDG